MSRLLLAAALLASPAAAYIIPATGGSGMPARPGLAGAALEFEPLSLEFEEPAAEAQSAAAFGVLAAGFGVGAVLGWLNSRKQQVAGVAAAAAMAVSPVAANAWVNYEGLEFLGGSDKVDINNANIQAYRQFPGMFPTAAAVICTHGPYNNVGDIFSIPNVDPRLLEIIKKYEKNYVCLPANPAYFIDRVNNGMYR
ncbi:unnamed protein product [Polarella glacialis]|uniref:Photosystem II 12 kDa extrinsic protein n=1 Tax=Polarella glacialis TaxID=89957 RepID=A0A813F9H2_POLGL|nr:unnamed protein product [Polarella glacialis]CAE8681046.1 unnamed protein product [Polarella glacialis]